MKTVAILQARLNSMRLPGKMLLPLLGKPLVQQVIERVRRATTLDFVVLAYPLADHEAFFSVLKAFRDTPGVPLGSWAGQGDENDLVERYLGAARAYDADVIVRIPCDNPCVDPVYIDQAVEVYLNQGHMYYSNTTGFVDAPGRRYVDGVGAEVFSISRLKWLDRKLGPNTPGFREHLHLYFKQLDYYRLDKADIRLDVNTQDDYDFIADIYTHFGHNHFTASQIVAYLHQKEVPHALEERVQQESH